MTKDDAFARLAKSKFRSRFKLTAKDREYIVEKGMDTIRRHAEDFVAKKLAPAQPENDGKQTPMRGHPVFKAMHGSAMCCRGCVEKWECAEEASLRRHAMHLSMGFSGFC